MKVTKVLVSCDNIHYAEMFPLVKEAWSRVCGYDCIVVYVGNELPDVLKQEKYKNSVFLFKPIEGIHTTFQTQCIRLLWPCLMHDEIVLISDMDIAPLQKEYFHDVLFNFHENMFVTYTDRYIKQYMFAMCYNVAHSRTWSEKFNVFSYEEICEKLKLWYNGLENKYDGQKNCPGWYTDQKQLYKHIIDSPGVAILNDAQTKFKRMDKKQKKFILSNIEGLKKDIQNKIYTDFHFIRPYSKFHRCIKILVQSSYN